MAATRLPDSSAPSLSRTEHAIQVLEALAQGHPAGVRLGTKEELRSLCGVAVGTFNEAIRIVEGRGTIRLRPGPGGGIFRAEPNPMLRIGNALLDVGGGDAAAATSALRIRIALEPLMVRDAIQHGSEVDFDRVRAALRALRDRDHDPLAFLRAIWDLHRRVAEISPDAILRAVYIAMLDTLTSNTTSVDYGASDVRRDHMRERYALHAKWVDAITSRNTDAALAVTDEFWVNTDD